MCGIFKQHIPEQSVGQRKNQKGKIETNLNRSTIYQYLWNDTVTVLRGKSFIGRKEIGQIKM